MEYGACYNILATILIILIYPLSASSQVDGNVIHFHSPASAVPLDAHILVQDARIDTSLWIGSYRTKKGAHFKVTIPLRLDSTFLHAIQGYLDRWYTGIPKDSEVLLIQVKKYLVYDDRVAFFADAYWGIGGHFKKILSRNFVIKKDWKDFAGGQALDLLMSSVRSQGRNAPAGEKPVTLAQIEAERDGSGWDSISAAMKVPRPDGIFLTPEDFVQCRVHPSSIAVRMITGAMYPTTNVFYKANGGICVSDLDTLYVITWSKTQGKGDHRLRRWGRRPGGIATYNGEYYIRLEDKAYLKLRWLGNRFAAAASVGLVSAFNNSKFQWYQDINKALPGGPNYISSGGGFNLLGGLGAVFDDDKLTRDQLLSRYATSAGGLDIYVDMDLGVVIYR